MHGCGGDDDDAIISDLGIGWDYMQSLPDYQAGSQASSHPTRYVKTFSMVGFLF